MKLLFVLMLCAFTACTKATTDQQFATEKERDMGILRAFKYASIQEEARLYLSSAEKKTEDADWFRGHYHQIWELQTKWDMAHAVSYAIAEEDGDVIVRVWPLDRWVFIGRDPLPYQFRCYQADAATCHRFIQVVSSWKGWTFVDNIREVHLLWVDKKRAHADKDDEAHGEFITVTHTNETRVWPVEFPSRWD